MAFYVVRDRAFICYGPSSRQDCEKQLLVIEKVNLRFFPGSKTELFRDPSQPRVTKHVDQEETEATNEQQEEEPRVDFEQKIPSKSMIDELIAR